MGKIALKPLSFELGYFMIEILLDFITKRKLKKWELRRRSISKPERGRRTVEFKSIH